MSGLVQRIGITETQGVPLDSPQSIQKPFNSPEKEPKLPPAESKSDLDLLSDRDSEKSALDPKLSAVPDKPATPIQSP